MSEAFILTIYDKSATLYVTMVTKLSHISAELDRTRQLTPAAQVKIDHWQLHSHPRQFPEWKHKEQFAWHNGPEKYVGCQDQ